jgi:hypothetical protein
MAIVLTLNDTLAEIVNEIEKMSPKEQHVLLLKLKRNELITKAKTLGKSVKKNKTTTQQTLHAVKKWNKTA